LKQSEAFAKKKIGIPKNRNKDSSSFKLNSIVEEARMEVQELPAREYSDNLTDSIATNSREEANRSRHYDVAKINSKMQMIGEKNRREKEMQEELGDMIDIDHEEDEFLVQHLEREKKN
jgi:hypothetical protein